MMPLKELRLSTIKVITDLQPTSAEGDRQAKRDFLSSKD